MAVVLIRGGADASLTATAGDGFKFTGWTGDVSGDDNPLTISVSQFSQYYSKFAYDAPQRHSLTVGVDPIGHGWVHGGGSFIAETRLLLLLHLAHGTSSLDGAGLNSTDNPLKTTMDKDLSITANFSYDVGDRFVRVGEGKFTMGNPSKSSGPEGPAHEVFIDSFFIDKFEITRGIWRSVMAWGKSNGICF